MAFPHCSPAQSAEGVLAAGKLQKLAARRGADVEAKIPLEIRAGYHVNSNAPNDPYLIPLRLRWENGPLQNPLVSFPKPEQRNYSFSKKPVSVFTGSFQISTKFKVAENAPRGPGILIGQLRYQACNENSCLPPKNLEIRLPYTVQ